MAERRLYAGSVVEGRRRCTEALLHYAEENADEVFDVIEEGAAAMIRELERKEAEAARAETAFTVSETRRGDAPAPTRRLSHPLPASRGYFAAESFTYGIGTQ
jgi:hypothetical protein